MRRVISWMIAMAIIVSGLPLCSSQESLSSTDYHANDDQQVECAPLGYGAGEATNQAINMSMLGWGLGLAIFIAILAGIIHQSASTHSDDSTSSSS